MKRLYLSLIFILFMSASFADPAINLLNASKTGNLKYLKQALNDGADIDSVDKGGNTALHLASKKGYINTVRLLIRAGADANLKRKDGKTALILAISGKHDDVAMLLIEKGANVNIQDDYGITAIMFASYHGMSEIVKLLIEKGADVNKRNLLGMTPLMYVTKYPHASGSSSEVAQLLVNGGANVNAKDSDGNSALSYANKTGSQEIPELLEKSGASEEKRHELNSRDNNQTDKTIMQIAKNDKTRSYEKNPKRKQNGSKSDNNKNQDVESKIKKEISSITMDEIINVYNSNSSDLQKDDYKEKAKNKYVRFSGSILSVDKSYSDKNKADIKVDYSSFKPYYFVNCHNSFSFSIPLNKAKDLLKDSTISVIGRIDSISELGDIHSSCGGKQFVSVNLKDVRIDHSDTSSSSIEEISNDNKSNKEEKKVNKILACQIEFFKKHGGVQNAGMDGMIKEKCYLKCEYGILYWVCDVFDPVSGTHYNSGHMKWQPITGDQACPETTNTNGDICK